MSRRRPLLVSFLLLPMLGGCAPKANVVSDDVPVTVGSIALDRRDTPVVILEEADGPRVLPIWIGAAEATSIAIQLREISAPRPNSHDLAQRLIQQLDAEVVRVVVTELRHGTYYAVLTLRTGGKTVEIDVRPSDGIAVALRTDAPILVRASVFDAAGEFMDDDGPRPSIRWNTPEDANQEQEATDALML